MAKPQSVKSRRSIALAATALALAAAAALGGTSSALAGANRPATVCTHVDCEYPNVATGTGA
ncbi:hypothetical protein AB0G73_33555 [Streptomyces sp. NPDC020719]|uniref:hypothetical protein n=1 Tax=Streptomyces sp. NPDC020719 TaxID=3154896 RepID=UPI0033ECD617